MSTSYHLPKRKHTRAWLTFLAHCVGLPILWILTSVSLGIDFGPIEILFPFRFDAFWGDLHMIGGLLVLLLLILSIEASILCLIRRQRPAYGAGVGTGLTASGISAMSLLFLILLIAGT